MKTEVQQFYVGDTCMYHVEDMGFQVEILEVRNAYGRVDYRVEPIAGTGNKWVSQISLEAVK